MNKVQVFSEGDLLKTHQRSYIPGTWITDEADYPQEKSKYLLKHTSHYQEQALRHGEHVCMVGLGIIMAEHAYRNLRKVQALFRLADKYGSEALNLTCRRCLYYDTYRMRAIKTILEKNSTGCPLKVKAQREAMLYIPEGKTLCVPSNASFIQRRNNHEYRRTDTEQTEAVKTGWHTGDPAGQT